MTYFSMPGAYLDDTSDLAAKIKEIVATFFDQKASDFVRKNRNKHLVLAKHTSVYFTLGFMPEMFLKDCGKLYGFDYSSTSKARKSIANRIATDPDYSEKFEKLKQLLIMQLAPARFEHPVIVKKKQLVNI